MGQNYNSSIEVEIELKLSAQRERGERERGWRFVTGSPDQPEFAGVPPAQVLQEQLHREQPQQATLRVTFSQALDLLHVAENNIRDYLDLDPIVKSASPPHCVCLACSVS